MEPYKWITHEGKEHQVQQWQETYQAIKPRILGNLWKHVEKPGRRAVSCAGVGVGVDREATMNICHKYENQGKHLEAGLLKGIMACGPKVRGSRLRGNVGRAAGI